MILYLLAYVATGYSRYGPLAVGKADINAREEIRACLMLGACDREKKRQDAKGSIEKTQSVLGLDVSGRMKVVAGVVWSQSQVTNDLCQLPNTDFQGTSKAIVPSVAAAEPKSRCLDRALRGRRQRSPPTCSGPKGPTGVLALGPGTATRDVLIGGGVPFRPEVQIPGYPTCLPSDPLL